MPAARGVHGARRGGVRAVQGRPLALRCAPPEHRPLTGRAGLQLQQDRTGPSAHDPPRGHTWIASWGFDVSAGEPDFPDDVVLSKIRSFAGDLELEIELEIEIKPTAGPPTPPRTPRGTWPAAATPFRRHPPSSGLRSNASIQDRKIAYKLNGHSDQSLLATYREERTPVGKHVVLRAHKSRVEYATVNECFRTVGQADPVASAVAKLRVPSPRASPSGILLWRHWRPRTPRSTPRASNSTSVTRRRRSCPTSPSARRSGPETPRYTCRRPRARREEPACAAGQRARSARVSTPRASSR